MPLHLPLPPQTYTGDKLDKSKANYTWWRTHADLFLTSCSLRGYVTGRIPPPPSTEPHALANWQADDEMAAALLFGTLDETEWQFLDRSLGAKACWDAIVARHQDEGPIRRSLISKKH